MGNNSFTAELENALAGAEKLAVEKSTEILTQEWPKIGQTFGQLIADGERDMKVSVDVFLTSGSEGIGVKAGMTYKVVRKARVGEGFARFDGTVQQELPIGDGDCNADEGETDGPAINLEETAVKFGFINEDSTADMDALFAAAKEIFTTACRNSSFLLIRQIGVSLEEAQAIMKTMRDAGDLDVKFDPLSETVDEGVEQDATEKDAEQSEFQITEADAIPDDASTAPATEWADTQEESDALLVQAVEILSKSAKMRPTTLQRKLGLSFVKTEALYRAALTKIEDDKREGDAMVNDVTATDGTVKTCVDCSKFDECPIAKPNETNVECDGFTARDGAQ